MKILLCIESGYEEDDHVGFDGAGTWFDDSGRALPFNEDNEHALELALRLKDQLGKSCQLTVVCIGADRARAALRRCLSFGCDRGIQIVDSLARRRRQGQLGAIIARFCRKSSFDIILTGAGFNEVGSTAARSLGCGSADKVAGGRYQERANVIECELEGADLPLQLQLATPVVLTCRTGHIIPRLPSLSTLLNGKKKQITAYQVADFLGKEADTAGAGRVSPAFAM